MSLLFKVIQFLYPNYCANCGILLSNDASNCFCNNCWNQIKIIKTQTCKKCGKPVITEKGICQDCKKEKFYYEKIKVIGLYEDILKKAIHLYKYNERFKLSKDFANLIIQNTDREFFLENDIIIPVPISKKRLLQRGFSQTYLIAKYLGKHYNIPVLNNILIKKFDTPPQSTLSREKRLVNLQNSFAINENLKEKIFKKRILLFDDVFTTGTTVNECSRVLKFYNADKINVLTIARGV